jgi:hypothetical protein
VDQPIALAVAQSEGRIRPHDRALLAAFVGGLTWGVTVVKRRPPASAPARSEPAVAYRERQASVSPA